MMTNFEKTTIVSATSEVDDTTVMQMRASIAEDGTFSVNKSVKNSTLYVENEAECKADFEEFQTKVTAIIKA